MKPIAVNPFKLSQPMGATLAFLGVKNCMPLMHGAQGCASFTKVFFTRHFNDPIAIQTTAVNDITAVFDGGEYGVTTAVENITKKITPDLIGLFSTGLTETKGDDLRGAASKLETLSVWVNTPDFEGSLESGWSLSVEAMIEQLCEPKSEIQKGKAVVLPHVSMSALDVERLKEFLEDFGFSEVLALPDISASLDGFLGEKQGAMSAGGIEVGQIKELASSELIVSIGHSLREAGEKLSLKNPNSKLVQLDGLGGLEATDNFVSFLLELGFTPNAKVKRWRARLQDALLDTHFVIGKARFCVALEPDQATSVCSVLAEAGAKIEHIFVPFRCDTLSICDKNVVVGDMEDVAKVLENIDIIVTNEHGVRIANSKHKVFVPRGFPLFETLGSALKSDILYEGSCSLLFECANALENAHKE
jgi:nitrogenase molybdenum-iron protein NifN